MVLKSHIVKYVSDEINFIIIIIIIIICDVSHQHYVNGNKPKR